MADDWISAMSRLSQGLQHPEGATIGPAEVPPWYFDKMGRRGRSSSGEAEALPLGDPADPISQIALLLAPILRSGLLSRGAASRAVPSAPAPAAAPPNPMARLQALREGGLPGTRLETPRPSSELYRADMPVTESRGLRGQPGHGRWPYNDQLGSAIRDVQDNLAFYRERGVDVAEFEQRLRHVQETPGQGNELERLGNLLDDLEMHSERALDVGGFAEQRFRQSPGRRPNQARPRQVIREHLQEMRAAGMPVAHLERQLAAARTEEDFTRIMDAIYLGRD